MNLQARCIAILVASLAGCTGGDSVDPTSALPGRWQCDDDIAVEFRPGGRYEWRIPAGGPVHIPPGENELVRAEADGSYSLLGAWRLSGSALELDMLGETDKYTVSFKSADALSLSGPEEYSCARK